MAYWNFKYLIKENGRDFQAWMDSQPHKVRATIHEIMDYIEINQELDIHVTKLKDYKGIWELKAKVNKIQYRPLFFVGPSRGELTFLIGATKTGDHKKTKFDPINAPKTAEKRRKLIFKNGENIGVYTRTKK